MFGLNYLGKLYLGYAESVTFFSIAVSETITISDYLVISKTSPSTYALIINESITVSESIGKKVDCNVDLSSWSYQNTFDAASIPSGWTEKQGSWSYPGGYVSFNTPSGADPTHLLYTAQILSSVRIVKARVTFNSLPTVDQRLGIVIHGSNVAAGGNGINLVYHGDGNLSFLNDTIAWGASLSAITPNVGESWWFKGLYDGSTYYGKAWKVGTTEPNWMISWTLAQPANAYYSGLTGNSLTGTATATYDDFIVSSNSETISIGENVTGSVSNINSYQTNSSETITINESLNGLLTSYINTSENISVSESISLAESNLPTLLISVSDSITVSENIIAQQSYVFTINKSETILVKETVSFPFGKSLYFDGNSYITASMAPNANGFNMAFWMKVETYGNNEKIIDATGGSNSGFRFGRSAGVNVRNLYFQVFNAGSNLAQIAYTNVDPIKPMHIVMTFAPNDARFYVDKSLQGTDNSCTIGTFDGTFTIGAAVGGSNKMQMTIDRMVWQNSPTPWSQTDINNLYDFGTIPAGASYWDFENNLNDLSGNGETLTVQAGTSYVTNPFATVSVIEAYSVSVLENITATENINGSLSLYQLSVSENITVSESLAISIVSAGVYSINVYESIAILESIGKMQESYVTESDNITITESIGKNLSGSTLQSSPSGSDNLANWTIGVKIISFN